MGNQRGDLSQGADGEPDPEDECAVDEGQGECKGTRSVEVGCGLCDGGRARVKARGVQGYLPPQGCPRPSVAAVQRKVPRSVYCSAKLREL